MVSSIKRLAGRVVNYQRDQWFAMRRYRPRGNSIMWLPNVVVFRSKNNAEGNPRKGLTALVLSTGPFIAVGMLFAASLDLPIGLNIIAFLASPLLGLLLLLGVVKGQRDFKAYRRTRNLQQVPSAENATAAIDYLDSRQPITRLFALRAILPVCSGTPGKLVKHHTEDVSTVAETLVERLKDENQEIRRDAAAVIKWFTRDYGRAFGPHTKLMSRVLEQPDSEIQADLAIALANIGATSDSPRSFARALTPAVKDEDPDVRQAAAVALRNLRSDPSVKMLKHLSEDSVPVVRQEARESLHSFTTGRTTTSDNSDT